MAHAVPGFPFPPSLQIGRGGYHKTMNTTCGTHPRIIVKPVVGCRMCNLNQQEHGEDKSLTTFVYHSGPDDERRYHFSVWFWAESHHSGPSWRGQHFFADPAPYWAQAKVHGAVREINKSQLAKQIGPL